MMTRRIRTVYQRTPMAMREIIERHERINRDLTIEVARLRGENANQKAELSQAKFMLNLMTGIEKVDVVIPVPREGITTYFIIDHNHAMPIFGVQPGDKILLARKKIL